MAEAVAYVQAKRLPPDAYLFADKGQFFRHGNFYKRQWKDACAAAGIAGVRFYDYADFRVWSVPAFLDTEES